MLSSAQYVDNLTTKTFMKNMKRRTMPLKSASIARPSSGKLNSRDTAWIARWNQNIVSIVICTFLVKISRDISRSVNPGRSTVRSVDCRLSTNSSLFMLPLALRKKCLWILDHQKRKMGSISMPLKIVYLGFQRKLVDKILVKRRRNLRWGQCRKKSKISCRVKQSHSQKSFSI